MEPTPHTCPHWQLVAPDTQSRAGVCARCGKPLLIAAPLVNGAMNGASIQRATEFRPAVGILEPQKRRKQRSTNPPGRDSGGHRDRAGLLIAGIVLILSAGLDAMAVIHSISGEDLPAVTSQAKPKNKPADTPQIAQAALKEVQVNSPEAQTAPASPQPEQEPAPPAKNPDPRPQEPPTPPKAKSADENRPPVPPESKVRV